MRERVFGAGLDATRAAANYEANHPQGMHHRLILVRAPLRMVTKPFSWMTLFSPFRRKSFVC